MSVRVRMFAAAREAAGEPETQVPPGPLSTVLATLADRYGERFATVLTVATVLVDGSHVDRDLVVPDGSEVAILPPFSGGSPVPTSCVSRRDERPRGRAQP